MRNEIPKNIVEQWKVIGPVMAALGSVIRQRIIMIFEPGEQLNIKRIADQFNLSRTAVAHHIGVLQEAGVLKGERVGKEVLMYVDWDLILRAVDKVKSQADFFSNLKNNFRGGGR
ncbi:MAG: winged helix-turn-helix domain-containing protein [Candidatus Adiutrix sp.]|jgi:predicted transcriptional regulator|nr:winged helix-turn-helix domain-containing protein [Candidatus Adiutrix sp.]